MQLIAFFISCSLEQILKRNVCVSLSWLFQVFKYCGIPSSFTRSSGTYVWINCFSCSPRHLLLQVLHHLTSSALMAPAAFLPDFIFIILFSPPGTSSTDFLYLASSTGSSLQALHCWRSPVSSFNLPST